MWPPSILDWISSLDYFGFILLSYELTTESYKHDDSIKQPQTVWHIVEAQQSMTNSNQQQSNELTLCSITLAADVLLHLLLLLGMLGTQTAHVLLQSHQHRLFRCQLSLISGHRTTQLLSTFLHRTEHGIFRPWRTYLLQKCTGAATRHTTAVYKFWSLNCDHVKCGSQCYLSEFSSVILFENMVKTASTRISKKRQFYSDL